MSNNKQQPKPENPNNQFSNTEPLTHAQRVAIANTISNNKQSSVEWLHIEFQKRFPKETYEMYNNNQLAYEQMILQAKEMHKEEVTSFTADWSIQYKYENGKNINQYYNETFGGNNE